MIIDSRKISWSIQNQARLKLNITVTPCVSVSLLQFVKSDSQKKSLESKTGAQMSSMDLVSIKEASGY